MPPRRVPEEVSTRRGVESLGSGQGEAHVGFVPHQVRAKFVLRLTLELAHSLTAEIERLADFFEGEPFLLARFGSAEGPFVYIAVPADRLAEVEGLVPLERVDVTGRVRTGASSLTGAPIIDLITLTRARQAP